jgi:arabinogalactan endo-1,4-beta-galactosidase
MTKLEEATRALYRASTGNNPPDRAPDAKIGEDASWTKWCRLTRAVVETLREPTEAMKAAAARIPHAQDKEIYQAMIDAILKEAEEAGL